MRKLAIALGVSVTMLLAGAMAWKADAMTWRSGTWNLPAAAKNYSPIETTACYGPYRCWCATLLSALD